MKNRGMILAGVAWLLAHPCMALVQTASWEPADLRGWVCYDVVTERVVDALRVDGDALAVRFPQQGMKLPPEEYLLRADANASGGAFTGDYFAIGAKSISFSVFQQEPGSVAVVMVGGGKWWRCRLGELPAGAWHEVSVSIDPDVLHSLGATDNAAEFAAMLRDVEWVGVLFSRASVLHAYDAKIAQFTLSAAGSGYGEWISGYEGSDVDKLATRDLSGSGFGNIQAWVAGVAADGRDGGFVLSSSTRPDASSNVKPVIKWRSVAGREYQIHRTEDLRAPFMPVSNWMAATPDINVYEDSDAKGNGPYYYTIHVRLAQE